MDKVDVIRAWKDEEYRASLSDSEQAMLPQHPSGLIDLSDTELDGVAGGTDELEFLGSEHIFTLGCCPGLTRDPNYCTLLCSSGCNPTYDFSCK